MSTKLTEIPDTTEDLVELSNHVTLSRDATLSKIKTQLRTFGDYIMFLFNYTLFNSNITFHFITWHFILKRLNLK